MQDWHHENVNVDTIHGDEHDEFVVEIRGERHIITEREADALMGELSMYGARNPNNGGRYSKNSRGDVDE